MWLAALRRGADVNNLSVVGNLLALVLVAVVIVERPAAQSVSVTLFVSVGYALFFVLTKQREYLYPAVVLVSLAYLTLIRLVGTSDLYHALTVPFVVVLLAIGYFLERRLERGLALPFVIVGHLTIAAVVLIQLLSPGPIDNYALVILPLVVAAAAVLALVYLLASYWYVLPAALLFSSAYYFSLPLISAVPAALRPVSYTALSVLYLVAALVLRRWKGEALARPLVVASSLICGSSAFAVILGEDVRNGPPVLLLLSLVFAVLGLVYRRDEFIYAITLALALLGYNFMQASTDVFSRHLVEWFLYGLAIMAMFFLYPLMRLVFRWKWTIAKYLSKDWRLLMAVTVSAIVVVIVTTASYSLQIAENPSFCNSCHNMGSFYESWKRSGHVQKAKPESTLAQPVACNQCHYPPGFDSFVRGKMVGALEVVKFVTGDIATKPHTQIKDEACLACHSKEKLNKWIKFGTGDVMFNHEVMLQQPARGITLRCVSCHARTEASANDSHFSVSPGVCYLCHLKEREVPVSRYLGTAIGTCYTCHPSLDQRVAEKSFSTIGAGLVARDRCLPCHDKVERFEETQFQHDKHVTENLDQLKRKAECFDCHDFIRHGNLGIRGS